jgi:surfeit locus 1 family protein
MIIGPYEFRPGRVPTLLFAAMLPVLIGLGFWQVDRAEQKRAIIEAREQAGQAAPFSLNDRSVSRARAMHRPAKASGHYDSDHQFLLDNQVHNGRVGYRILTPLLLKGTDRAVLVDRGWVPAPASRKVLPDISVQTTPREVTGVIGRGPSPGLKLGSAYHGDGDWPRRVEYMDFGYFRSALPYPIPDYVLRQANGDGEALNVPPGIGMSPKRHLGYAVQWFALATALVAIYVLVNTRRREGQ